MSLEIITKNSLGASWALFINVLDYMSIIEMDRFPFR